MYHKSLNNKEKIFSIAPMMDWTDPYDRYFLRLISRHAYLYSEMVTADAVIHGNRNKLLGFDAVEHPVALQLGGSDPAKLAEAARIGADYGYDEINLNVGCPSDRVQSGRFGACLMTEPDLVAECVATMSKAVSVAVTVKCRIGVDDQDVDVALDDLAARVFDAGVECLIVHARKAWLKGLSPKENRDVPPLDYDRVYRLKQRFAQKEIIINGGIDNHDECATHLKLVDGVMLGRVAYQNPYILAPVDTLYYGSKIPAPSRHQIVENLLPYVERNLSEGMPLNRITRHILGLFQGCPGARRWRRHLSENAHLPGAGIDVIVAAAALVEEGVDPRAVQLPTPVSTP
jgi:tRNA-dihydrouridine synthase A